MSMNRQLRRAQEKQDKKLEKEKAERRAERRRRLDQLRAQRQRKAASRSSAKGNQTAASRTADNKTAVKPGRNDPGRFSGALAIATVVFIMLQAVVPAESEGTFDSAIKAGFYLMLGYFLTLWLLRRNQPHALILTGLAGVILLTGTWLGYLLRPDAVVDGLAMLLSLPLLAVGIWLARLVSNMARSQNAA